MCKHFLRYFDDHFYFDLIYSEIDFALRTIWLRFTWNQRKVLYYIFKYKKWYTYWIQEKYDNVTKGQQNTKSILPKINSFLVNTFLHSGSSNTAQIHPLHTVIFFRKNDYKNCFKWIVGKTYLNTLGTILFGLELDKILHLTP